MNKNHLLSLALNLLFCSSDHPQRAVLLVLKAPSLFRHHKRGYLRFSKLRDNGDYSIKEMKIDIEEVQKI